MKLAEALQERADLNLKIQDLERRLSMNALVQEGESPAENPKALLNELDSCLTELEILITRINLTNASTKVNNRTLTELIAKKDVLQLKISAYKNIAAEANSDTSRARRTEIKVKPTMKASTLQKQIDSFSKELRELDNLLQKTNWTTDLR